jgi:hypothetical protein
MSLANARVRPDASLTGSASGWHVTWAVLAALVLATG